MHKYFVLYKPYNMVSQFRSNHVVPLLCDLAFDFPAGIHAIGRLDKDSEGLLLLTTDKKVTKLLFQGTLPHHRTYFVKLNRAITNADLDLIRTGVHIDIGAGIKYLTPPCKVEIIPDPESMYHIPHIEDGFADREICWISITLTEGKFRQVRKMVTSIRYKVKRLIRVSIEGLNLGDLQSGEIKELDGKEFYEKLKLVEGK